MTNYQHHIDIVPPPNVYEAASLYHFGARISVGRCGQTITLNVTNQKQVTVVHVLHEDAVHLRKLLTAALRD